MRSRTRGEKSCRSNCPVRLGAPRLICHHLQESMVVVVEVGVEYKVPKWEAGG